MKINCEYCGKEIEKYIGHVNRSRKKGYKLYCNQTCSGLDRRKTIEEKKKVKAEYDKKIYSTPERIAARKRYFQKSYKDNPEKYRQERRRRYKAHLQYLQRPEYKKWKHEYDQKHLAKKEYGIFWEAYLLLKELELWLLKNSPEGMKFQMGITNKSQKRKRLWQKTFRQKSSQLRA